MACRRCPRLVAWRERVAREKVARFRDETYWGRPVPGFGDPDARILLLGLAPAAHGGNRTGRVFTGDASGDFLWAALHAVGLADRPASRRADDGLTPDRRVHRGRGPLRAAGQQADPEERDTCAPFLVRELGAADGGAGRRGARGVRLGRGAASLRGDGSRGRGRGRGSATEPRSPVGPYTLLGSYHPSQQNTFTGRLTPAMFDAVLRRAIVVASA